MTLCWQNCFRLRTVVLGVGYIYCLLHIYACSPLTPAVLVDTLPNRDGRFSIASGEKNIMYAWHSDSATWVSSHFIVNKDGAYASNHPLMSEGDYLLGDIHYFEREGNSYTETSYEYQGIKIIQRLVPVKKNFKDIRKEKHIAQYYRIEYELENLTDTLSQIGLKLLIDTKMNQNDRSYLKPKEGSRGLGFDFLKKKEIEYKSKTYSGKSVPKRIRIYETTPKDKEGLVARLEMKRKDALRPRQAAIGHWPTFYDHIWAVGSKGEYEDAAIELRWPIEKLKKGEKRIFSTYLGPQQPNIFKRIGGSKKGRPELSLAYQRQVDYLGRSYLYPKKDTITLGELATLNWSISRSPHFTDLESNVPELDWYEGKTMLRPLVDERYWMSMRIEKSKVRVVYDTQIAVVTPEGEDLGRFTIGADNQELTFGYPYPVSTSHVIVKIKDAISVPMASERAGGALESVYLSNAPELTPENLLKGRLDTIKHFGSKGYQILYSWDSLLIYQRLMPVDSNFNYADNGQYYRISYDLINTSKERTRELGLTFMLDPNIAGNDNADIRIDSLSLMDTVIFQMPNALDIIYGAERPEQKARLILDRRLASPPDRMYIGLWQEFRSLKLPQIPNVDEYPRDCAIFLEWEYEKLAPLHSRQIVFYYGNPQSRQIDLNFHKTPMKRLRLYYDLDEHLLIQGELNVLKNLYKTHLTPIQDSLGNTYIPYSHIVLEGFTGSRGSKSYNYELAQRRLQTVVSQLISLGVPAEKVLLKNNGKYYADETPPRQMTRNHERMVQLTVF